MNFLLFFQEKLFTLHFTHEEGRNAFRLERKERKTEEDKKRNDKN